MTAVNEIILFCGESKELKSIKDFAFLKLDQEEKQCDNAYDCGVKELSLILKEVHEKGYDFDNWEELERLIKKFNL